MKSVVALDTALCCKIERPYFLEMLVHVGCKLTSPLEISENQRFPFKWIQLRGISVSNLVVVGKSTKIKRVLYSVMNRNVSREGIIHIEKLTIDSPKDLECDKYNEEFLVVLINNTWKNLKHITLKLHPTTMKKFLCGMYTDRLAHLLSLELVWAADPFIIGGLMRAADDCKELTSLMLIAKRSFVEATTLGRFVNTNRGLVALEVTIERLSDEIIAVFSEGKCLKHVTLHIQYGFNLKSLRMFLEACPNLTSFSAMLHHCGGHHEQFNLDMFTNTCSNFVCEVHLKFLGPARYANGIVHTTFNHAQNGDAEVSNVLLSA